MYHEGFQRKFTKYCFRNHRPGLKNVFFAVIILLPYFSELFGFLLVTASRILKGKNYRTVRWISSPLKILFYLKQKKTNQRQHIYSIFYHNYQIKNFMSTIIRRKLLLVAEDGTKPIRGLIKQGSIHCHQSLFKAIFSGIHVNWKENDGIQTCTYHIGMISGNVFKRIRILPI